MQRGSVAGQSESIVHCTHPSVLLHSSPIWQRSVPFTPHSIGLSHTDEPGPGGSSTFWTKDNIVLEENMVLSIDMPIKASGIGGSAHLEDLTLITKDGAVQINDIGDRSFMV